MIIEHFEESEAIRKRLSSASIIAPFFSNKPTFYYDIKELMECNMFEVQPPTYNWTKMYNQFFRRTL